MTYINSELSAAPILQEFARNPDVNGAVAARLHRPEKTLDNHLAEINQLLGVGSIEGAMVIGLDRELIHIPQLTDDEITAVDMLSMKQFQAALLLANGMSRKQVAQKLHTSVKGVGRRMDRVAESLGHAHEPRPLLRSILTLWAYEHEILIPGRYSEQPV